MDERQVNEATEYLSRLLPWPLDGQGYVNIHWKMLATDTKREIWTGRAVRTVQSAVGLLKWLSTMDVVRDIYACQSLQSQAKEAISSKGKKILRAERSTINAMSLRSLFLDVDIAHPANKDPNKGYADGKVAVQAVAAFVQDTGLPKPTAVIHSGSGLHVYWTFAEQVSVDQWARLAFALAEAAKEKGLRCDTQCTIDAARILRVPGTLNHKYGDPKPVVRTLKAPADDYFYSRLEKPLEPWIGKVSVPTGFELPRRVTTEVIENELGAGIDPREASLVPLDEAIKECGFLAEAKLTGGATHTNPLWNTTVLLATFLEDGQAAAHDMSCGHADYDYDTTEALYQRKLRERDERNIGWPSCKTISAQGSPFCQACKHFAAGKSPLNHAPKQTAPVAVVPASILKLSTLPPGFNDMPEGYARYPDGRIFRVETNEDGSQSHSRVIDRPVLNPWLTTNPHMLHFTTQTDIGTWGDVQLPFEVIAAPDQFRKHLGGAGVMESENTYKGFREFVVSWIKKLQANVKAIQSSPFGWSVKNGKVEGFTYAQTVFTPNGERKAANADPQIAMQYTPTGEVAPWVKAARLITDQKRPALDAILASAFAAPLVRFTQHSGLILSAFSMESGIGKTTTLKTAQAVWGSPQRAPQQLDDTNNSVMKKIGQIQVLPLYWDEIKGDEDTNRFVKLIFGVTSGREKTRLKASTEMNVSGTWQTMMVSCSNDSLVDHIIKRTPTTTAGLHRIFEYTVEPGTQGQILTSDAQVIVGELNDNYGMIGLEYAKYLGVNHEQVRHDVEEMCREVEAEVGGTNDERLWRSTIAVLLQGAIYSNGLGFTDINLEELKTFLVTCLGNLRQIVVSQPVGLNKADNIASILAQFLDEARTEHTLFTDRIHIGQGAVPFGSIKITGDHGRLKSIWVHVGRDSQLMRISSTAMNEWLKQRGYPSYGFREALKRDFGAKINVKARLGAGTQFSTLQQYVIEMDLSDPTLAQFM